MRRYIVGLAVVGLFTVSRSAEAQADRVHGPAVAADSSEPSVVAVKWLEPVKRLTFAADQRKQAGSFSLSERVAVMTRSAIRVTTTSRKIFVKRQGVTMYGVGLRIRA